MEGACVYINNDNKSVLVMYKEIKKRKEICNNIILLARYSEQILEYGYINDKYFTKIIPIDCIHILTSLPYYDDINKTLDIWKKIVLNRLNYLNTNNNNNNNNNINKNYCTQLNHNFENFNTKFSKKNVAWFIQL